MRELTFKKSGRVNTERLHEELVAWNDPVYVSLSTAPGKVIVRVEDAATRAQEGEVQALVENHDGTAKSQREQAREQQVTLKATLDAELGGVLDVADFSGLSALVLPGKLEALAKRVRRIEVALALRGDIDG